MNQVFPQPYGLQKLDPASFDLSKGVKIYSACKIPAGLNSVSYLPGAVDLSSATTQGRIQLWKLGLS